MSDTLTGNAGSATRITMVPEVIAANPGYAATLATWLLHCPGQSAAWSHYQLGVLHLRAIPGVPLPVLHYPEASHELIVFALDPEFHPTTTDIETLMPLLPVNVVHQWHGSTDEQAIEVARRAVAMVVKGLLPAEPVAGLGTDGLWARALARLIAQVEHDEAPPGNMVVEGEHG